MIANNDESVVREKAIESICKIAVNLKKEQHTADLFPILKRLAKGETYMMKISGTGLFPAVYPNLSPLNQTMLRQFYIDLCKDDTPMVRRAAATNFSKFVQVVDVHFVKAEFVPVIQVLITDTQDAVRVAAVECAGKVISLTKNDEVNTALLPALRNAASDKSSWRLRFMLAEATSGILENLCNKIVLLK